MRRPPLVERTSAASTGGLGDELGGLLHVLAAGRAVRRAASISQDASATAWLASALPPGVPLFVPGGDELVGIFADDSDIHVVGGAWAHALAPEAPFDLIHVDGDARTAVDGVLSLAMPRATLVIPSADVERWSGHPRLEAVVVTVGSCSAVVAVVRD